MAVLYEWDVESADEHGDIQDHYHAGRLSDLAAPMSSWLAPGDGGSNALVLVRDTGDNVRGLIDRHWVYVRDDGTLPDHFEDAMGNPGPTVPARFHAELAKWLAGGAK